MAAPDELSFPRASARIGKFMVVVAVLGTCGALLVGGWLTGAGFLLGAAISALNFYWLHQLVAGLGSGRKPGNRSVILGFRYLILGSGAYVILRVSSISLKGVLAGLFVLTAALFVEVIFEIFYGKRTVDHQNLQ
jgi:hypothetical protein